MNKKSNNHLSLSNQLIIFLVFRSSFIFLFSFILVFSSFSFYVTASDRFEDFLYSKIITNLNNENSTVAISFEPEKQDPVQNGIAVLRTQFPSSPDPSMARGRIYRYYSNTETKVLFQKSAERYVSENCYALCIPFCSQYVSYLGTYCSVGDYLDQEEEDSIYISRGLSTIFMNTNGSISRDLLGRQLIISTTAGNETKTLYIRGIIDKVTALDRYPFYEETFNGNFVFVSDAFLFNGTQPFVSAEFSKPSNLTVISSNENTMNYVSSLRKLIDTAGCKSASFISPSNLIPESSEILKSYYFLGSTTSIWQSIIYALLAAISILGGLASIIRFPSRKIFLTKNEKNYTIIPLILYFFCFLISIYICKKISYYPFPIGFDCPLLSSSGLTLASVIFLFQASFSYLLIKFKHKTFFFRQAAVNI